MNDARLNLAVDPTDCELLYDALRFARDEFLDENGLGWSNAEYTRLQEILGQIEAYLPVNSPSNA